MVRCLHYIGYFRKNQHRNKMLPKCLKFCFVYHKRQFIILCQLFSPEKRLCFCAKYPVFSHFREILHFCQKSDCYFISFRV